MPNSAQRPTALIEQQLGESPLTTSLPAETDNNEETPKKPIVAIDAKTRQLIDEFYDGPLPILPTKSGGKHDRIEKSKRHRQDTRIGKRNSALDAISFLKKQPALSVDTLELLKRADELNLPKEEFIKLSPKDQRDLSTLASSFIHRADGLREHLNGGVKRKPLNQGNVQEDENEDDMPMVEADLEEETALE